MFDFDELTETRTSVRYPVTMNTPPRHWRQQEIEDRSRGRMLGWVLVYTVTVVTGVVLTAILLHLS